ncbi:MAG TPA: signal peptide peptidase SppA [Cytophagales bacterium]|nr:signal peptide peptidase SppA [Cytophagales bacterium]HAA20127.1 signal peptide peptidase SppA [Cytophagales bacterium]HAP64065.1 signal peptide peptidase SppA [Cytophagales bacterium]
MKFLRNLLAVLVGLTLFTVVGIFILFGVAASFGEDEVQPISQPSILKLTLSGPIVERAEPDPLEELAIPFGGITPKGLQQIKQAIEHATNDPNIQGILLEPTLTATGWATLRDIRQALQEFKANSDKFVISYAEIYGEGDYYLASVADEVFLHPEGQIEFNGLAQEVTYIKGVLDKLGVEPQVFRVGQYKSAVEPFLRKDMSPESREQLESYLNALYATVLKDVGASRGIAEDQLENISDKMLVRNGADAETNGLIDGLAYYDEILTALREKTDKEEDDDLHFVSLTRYLNSWQPSGTYGKDLIAVIVGEGTITSGSSTEGTIGSDSFAKEVRKARQNDKVKAIVIRINSPGGSALASDVMWREITLAAEEKPVIASMGDVAASGGYYMAMGADKIVAQPNTITGSIGIFGVLFNAQGFLNDKLGVTTETVKTGELSDLYNLTRSLTPFERSIIQKQVEEGYETFTSKAAEGRGMAIEDLKAIAGGRVWAGTEALDNGLVDQMGNLEDAIALAAEEADVDDYAVRYYPKEQSILDLLMSDLTSGEYEERILQHQLGELYPVVHTLQEIKQYRGLQARLPYEIIIH